MDLNLNNILETVHAHYQKRERELLTENAVLKEQLKYLQEQVTECGTEGTE